MKRECASIKKTLALLLLTFAHSSAQGAAVRETLGSPSEETLVLWHTLNSVQSLVLKNSMEQFTRRTGIPVQLETGMDLTLGLLKQKHNGTLPDVVWGAADLIAIASEIDLSPIPLDAIPGTVGKRFIDELTLDKSPVGVPVLSGNHLVLYSNADLVPSPARSWEELLVQHKELSKTNIATLALPVGEPYYFLPFMLHAGAFADGVLSPDLGENWNKLAEAIRAYGTLIASGEVPRDCSFSCVSTGFMQGKFAYAISGDWQFAEAQAALGDKLRVSSLPSLNGKPMRSISASQGLFFPGHSLEGPRRMSLRMLVRHLLDEAEQYKFALETGRIPVTSGAMARLARANLPTQQKNLVRIFHESLPLRSTRETVLTWLLLRKALRYQTQDVAPTATIVEFLQARTRQQLQSYRGETQ